MPFFAWDTREAFDQWHEAAKVALGIPKISFRAGLGADASSQWTTEYTSGQMFDESFIAFVEDEVAAVVPTGLGTLTAKPHPPIPRPTEGGPYRWDEATQSWVEITPEA